MRRVLCLLAVAASLAVPSVVHAQASAPHPGAVEKFLAGKKHRDEGHCDLAIKELLESVKIEPSIGAHYNLGVCYEKTNKKAALVNYQRAEEIAKDRNDDRLREIRAQRADFLARTPHLRLALPQPLPPDIKVTVDGDLIPTEELQSETIYFLPAGDKETYDVRVSASGYDDEKIAVDKGVVKKNLLVTVVLRKHSDGSTIAPPPARPEPKWGPFQFLGLGLIAVGAAGITVAAVSFISYRSDETNLKEKFLAAEAVAKGCASSSPPESPCAKNIATREGFRDQYNANEDEANTEKPVWLTFFIGGILAVGGGVALIVAGPKSEAKVDPGARAKANEQGPSFRLVPTMSAREQGLTVVGTF